MEKIAALEFCGIHSIFLTQVVEKNNDEVESGTGQLDSHDSSDYGAYSMDAPVREIEINPQSTHELWADVVGTTHPQGE